MKYTRRWCFHLLLACLSSLAVSQSRPELTVDAIMRDPKWLGAFPQTPFWSEDGKTLYFYWNPEGNPADSLYAVSRNGGAPHKISPQAQRRLPASGPYTRDYSKKVFERDGDIYILTIKTGEVLQVTNTLALERDPCFSFNEEAVLFELDNNLFAWKMANGQLTQLTDFRSGAKPKEEIVPPTSEQKYLATEELRMLTVLQERKRKAESTKRMNEFLEVKRPRAIYLGEEQVQNPELSPDGRYVMFRLQKQPRDTRTAQVPNYVTASAFTEDLATRTKVGEPVPTYRLGYWDIAADTVKYLSAESLPDIFTRRAFTTIPAPNDTSKKVSKPREVMWHGPFWSEDGERAFVVVLSTDNKDRWIAALDLPSGKLTTLDHQYDEAWIGGPSIVGYWSPGAVGWLPDNEHVWFCSEVSGYAHLYLVNVNTQSKQALTGGAFEITSPFISRDKKRWYFISNEAHPGEYHFYSMPLFGGARTRLTALVGENEVALSPDETRIAIRHSKVNEPWEIYLQPNQPGATAQRITYSTTEEFRKYPWRMPEFVAYPTRDGKHVYAHLYRPEKPNGAAVVFVHGAGYLQNAHNGWSYYFREYMFHHLLVDRGYTVLAPDYRASAGYGREWRTAIYRHMGGKDLEDVVDGAKFLVAQHGVDAKRLGVYGGSYGGFITLMAMFTTPEVFAAGAALRPVTDWAHYNHGYTANILNLPQADTLAYRRSSPIYFAEGLRGALLMCHGMVD
ncbi:prolyl oligopeptidase family serine peptidase, partial [candidate division KSB1 bacterium]|nr:prolyl oligopeptidase family serine peptidase [candidate division KSB1 bacterium]